LLVVYDPGDWSVGIPGVEWDIHATLPNREMFDNLREELPSVHERTFGDLGTVMTAQEIEQDRSDDV
jgi:hypothetical protein